MNKPEPSPCFDLSIEDNIAHIRMIRPDKANSMIREFWNDLPALIRDIDLNARARVIVISAEGKHFTSGMDLSVFAEGGVSSSGLEDKARMGEAFMHHLKSLQDAFTCLDEARMPVVAAIQGACIGGGMDMVSACDIRYATADAFFSIQETNIGMTADVGTFPRLCHIISQGWVREMAYTGRRVRADKAREIGLVNDVYDTHEAMMEAVFALAREIAANSPVAVTGCKRMINYARDHSVHDALDYVGVWNASQLDPAEMGEAFTAQAEKRAPNFADLKPVKWGM